MNYVKLAVTVAVIALPVGAVRLIKKSQWGPVYSTPQARIFGNPQAPVTVVEYSDFQCPICARVQPDVHKILKYYDGKAKLAFKYYPLTKIHPHAMAAAHAAECAADQNKFWPYAEGLYATQTQWAPLTEPTTSYMALAASVQLDTEKFRSCLLDMSKRVAIEKDMKEGEAWDVNATPTFLVGKDRVVGSNFIDDGAQVIEKALRQ